MIIIARHKPDAIIVRGSGLNMAPATLINAAIANAARDIGAEAADVVNCCICYKVNERKAGASSAGMQTASSESQAKGASCAFRAPVKVYRM